MKKCFLPVAFLCVSGTLFSMDTKNIEVKAIKTLRDGTIVATLNTGGHVLASAKEKTPRVTILQNGNMYVLSPHWYSILRAEAKKSH